MTGAVRSSVQPAVAALTELAGLKDEIGFRGSRPELVRRVETTLADLGAGLPEAVSGFATAVGEYAGSGVEAPDVPPELHEVADEAEGEGFVALDEAGGDLDGILVPEELVAPSGRGSFEDFFQGIWKAVLPWLTEEIESLRSRSPILPWRHRQPSIPGLVEPLADDYGGLVHGGVVLARDFRLVIRAFHYGQCSVQRRRRRLIDVVAGVCEKQDHDGRVLETWSTAPKLVDRYASTSVELARPFAGNGRRDWEGFYRPSSVPIRGLQQIVGEEAVPITDDGLPDPLYYLGRIRREMKVSRSASGFRRAPAPAEAIENPYFQVTPAQGGLFAIESPFVNVFVPGPGAENVFVAMARACRDVTLVGKGSRIRLRRFDRVQTWGVRLFE